MFSLDSPIGFDGFPNMDRQPWTPRSLPGTIGWWDADYSVLGLSTLLIDSVSDLVGGIGTASETGANRMSLDATGWNGGRCFDLGSAGTTGATTASTSLGVFSMFGVIQGNSGSEVPILHNSAGGTNGSFLYGPSGPASNIGRTVRSAKSVSANWLADGNKHSFAVTFNGTHATHLVYKDGVDTVATTHAGLSNDPGTGSQAGAIYLGYIPAKNTGIRGKAKMWVVANRAWTPGEVAQLHRYAHSRGML
jgi:hypothetical protein